VQNLKAAIEAAGGTLDDIARVDVYVRDIADFDAIHAVAAAYFTGLAPASTMVEVSGFVNKSTSSRSTRSGCCHEAGVAAQRRLDYWTTRGVQGKREARIRETPKHPTFFTKGPDTVIGPFDDIAYDPSCPRSGLRGRSRTGFRPRRRDIPETRRGSTFSASAWQRRLAAGPQRAHGGQWLKGKSIDATMPLGPWITTVDEIADPYALRIQCEVNGERRQNASTGQMAFRFERLIAELSRGMTLRAGDVLLTGTPAASAMPGSHSVSRRRRRGLTHVSGLGTLRNRVAQSSSRN